MSIVSATLLHFPDISWQVLDFFGSEDLSSCYQFVLLIQTAEHLTESFLGQEISIKIQPELKGRAYYRHGLIGEVVLHEQASFRWTRVYTIKVWPALRFLQSTMNCQLFKEQSFVEIIRTLFQQHQLEKFCQLRIDVSSQRERQLYVVQYNESALDFFLRMVYRAGFYFYFFHEKKHHVLVVSDSPKRYVCIETPIHLGQDHARSQYMKNAWLRGMQGQSGSSLFCSSNVESLLPGQVIAIEGERELGASHWLVRQVKHFIVNGQYSNKMLAMLPTQHQMNKIQVPLNPTIPGVTLATVVGPKGNDLYLNEKGMAKVKFAWDQKTTTESFYSCWLPVGQFAAGKGHGHQWLPRIGQSVQVDFIGGDIEKPVITGSFYDVNHLPAHDYAKRNNTNSWRSQLVPKKENDNCYHEFLLVDDVDSSLFKLTAHGDLITQCGQDERWQVKSGCKVNVKGDEFIKVGKKYILKAHKKIRLAVGESFIELLPNQLTLSADSIQLNSI